MDIYDLVAFRQAEIGGWIVLSAYNQYSCPPDPECHICPFSVQCSRYSSNNPIDIGINTLPEWSLPTDELQKRYPELFI